MFNEDDPATPAEPAPAVPETHQVSVTQVDGEIRIARNGDDPVVYAVSGGVTTVAAADLPTFVAFVDGAQLKES